MSLLTAVKDSHMLVISKKVCPNCVKLKSLLQEAGITYHSVVIEDYMEMVDDDDRVFDEIEYLKNKYKITSYPMVFIGSEHIEGGYHELRRQDELGVLAGYMKGKNVSMKGDATEF